MLRVELSESHPGVEFASKSSNVVHEIRDALSLSGRLVEGGCDLDQHGDPLTLATSLATRIVRLLAPHTHRTFHHGIDISDGHGMDQVCGSERSADPTPIHPLPPLPPPL